MRDRWTIERWKEALTNSGTDAEREAYERLIRYLSKYAEYYLLVKRSLTKLSGRPEPVFAVSSSE